RHNSPLLENRNPSPCCPFPSVTVVAAPAQATTLHIIGDYPYGRRHYPRAAPHRRAGAVPACDASVGVAPLRAGRG
ncbi:hypothetical protein BHM03_00057977, partial [Ensete ventricosum]